MRMYSPCLLRSQQVFKKIHLRRTQKSSGLSNNSKHFRNWELEQLVKKNEQKRESSCTKLMETNLKRLDAVTERHL